MSIVYKFRHRSRPTAPANGTNLARAEEPSVSPPASRADGNYAVGYGKPPVHSRFVKGRSGNPRGRPKGAKNLKTDLAEELYEHIQVREGDKAHRVTKQRAIVKSLAARAMKGDTRAIALIVSFVLRMMPPDEDGSTAAKNAARLDGTPLDDTDRAILNDYRQRILEGAKQTLGHQPDPDPNVGTASSSLSDDEEACHE